MKILKNVALGIFGIELAGNLGRWRKYKKRYKTGHFARFGMDKKLERLLPHRNGFYVELGASLKLILL